MQWEYFASQRKANKFQIYLLFFEKQYFPILSFGGDKLTKNSFQFHITDILHLHKIKIVY